jgi:hypothetical protein
MALMMAAFVIKGIQPGPNMIAGHPDLFWGLVASMWVGNCFLVMLNVPLVRYWLSVFKIPYAVLFPSILFFCCIGTYSVNNSLDDIYITAVFGLMGYMFLRLDLDAAPLMLGFILGPMLEENFRRAMLLSRGSFSAFVTGRSAARCWRVADRRHGIVIQVSDNDPAKWNLALNNAKNLQDDVGAANVDIEIVAYGPGIGMLKLESPTGCTHRRRRQSRRQGHRLRKHHARPEADERRHAGRHQLRARRCHGDHEEAARRLGLPAALTKGADKAPQGCSAPSSRAACTGR